MISIKNLSVTLGGSPILDTVSMDIFPGQFTVVLGNNGAGKSTLLHTLTGRNKIYSGDIFWHRIPLRNIHLKTLAQYRAVLSQHFSASFPIKVYNLVEMGALIHPIKCTKHQMDVRIQQALDAVGMLDFIDRNFISLSGGEQKKILLAKAFVQLEVSMVEGNPQYLFLDEPTASIDVHHSYKLLQLVKEKCDNEQLGIFAVFHDLNLAAQFADEIVFLKAGRVFAKGKTDQMMQSDLIQSVMGVKSIINPHPIYNCPHITTLPL